MNEEVPRETFPLHTRFNIFSKDALLCHFSCTYVESFCWSVMRYFQIAGSFSDDSSEEV